MSYLECLDREIADSKNKVSRFSQEKQSEANQGVTQK